MPPEPIVPAPPIGIMPVGAVPIGYPAVGVFPFKYGAPDNFLSLIAPPVNSPPIDLPNARPLIAHIIALIQWPQHYVLDNQ